MVSQIELNHTLDSTMVSNQSVNLGVQTTLNISRARERERERERAGDGEMGRGREGGRKRERERGGRNYIGSTTETPVQCRNCCL
jgi:hypothetical protein